MFEYARYLVFMLLLRIQVYAVEQTLYAVQGESLSGAQRRQLLNEEYLKFENRFLHHDDCATKLDAMSVTTFTFYRGSNLLYFRDMANQGTLAKSAFYDPKATPWIQGDMHVLNAGRFDNGEGSVVFDLSDFDNAFVANFLYDVYRLATSLVLIARNNSMKDDDAASCVKTFANSYRDQVKELAEDPKARLSPLDFTSAQGPIGKLLADMRGPQAMRKRMLDKWTVKTQHGLRAFDTENNPELAPLEHPTVQGDIEAAMVDYYARTVTSTLRGKSKYFRIQDVAKGGTGSLGTPRYYILISGPSRSDPEDDRILDVKLQGKPCVYHYLTPDQQAAVNENVDNDADRAVRATKSLLSDVDDHLGYMKIGDKYYSVRERSPYKKSLDLTSNLRLKDLQNLATQYGVLLANAHVRSARYGNEALGVPRSFEQRVADLTRSRRGGFAEEVADVALSYAIQVEYDFSLFRDSMSIGLNRFC